MNPNEMSLLQRTYELAEENNKLLKSLRRSGRITMIMRILYWTVIILLSFGAYIFIQPYVDSLKDVYGTAQDNLSNIKDLTDKINGIGF